MKLLTKYYQAGSFLFNPARRSIRLISQAFFLYPFLAV
jgi:hypothetical protein